MTEEGSGMEVDSRGGDGSVGRRGGSEGRRVAWCWQWVKMKIEDQRDGRVSATAKKIGKEVEEEEEERRDRGRDRSE
jgi:hypothetical protein